MKRSLLFLVTIIALLFTGCGEKTDIKTVVFISLSNVDDNTFNGFKLKMHELGWEEDKNIQYVITGAAQSVENLPEKVKFAKELDADLVLVSSTPATLEVKKQIQDIPVIFCPVNDPIGSGVLQNANKPEGNITGVRLPAGDYKRAEWLYQMVPSVKNVLVPFTPGDKSSQASREDIKTVAQELGFNLIEEPVSSAKNIDTFLTNISNNIDAIILPRDSIIESQVQKFVEYSIVNKIPLSAPSYQQVKKGALYTYGFIHTELGKDAATIANKVLKGVKVNDLPVKFGKAYLVVNKTTAQKIGMVLSSDVLNNTKLLIED